jgi:hypothetical protein
MTHTLTPTTTMWRPGIWDADPQQTQARMELLESLPVRIEEQALADILHLAGEGKTAKSIGWCISLDSLAVQVELDREHHRRALPRPLTRAQQQHLDEEKLLPRVDRLDMNRLARGTHVANYPLRQLIAKALDRDPDLSVSKILRNAGYTSTSHGARHLGFMRQSGSSRVGQTIKPKDAARVVRALGVDPVDVAGL